MKVLLFASSQDDPARVPPGESRQDIIQQELERRLGEPVVVVARRVWPDQRFPAFFSRTIDQEQPDVVLVPVVGYAFLFESVPLKLQRRLGRIGRWLGDSGKRMADVPWLAHSALFRGVRRLAQRTIGGVTYFTPEEIVACFGECVNIAARREGMGIIIHGPQGGAAHNGTSRKALERQEMRRRKVVDGLADVCRRHHVTLIRHERPRIETGEAFSTGADRLHYDRAGSRASAIELAGYLEAEIRRVQGGTLAANRV